MVERSTAAIRWSTVQLGGAPDAQARALLAHEHLKRLTPRQRQVLDRLVSGLINKQIAADLGIDEKTVKMHRANMLSAQQVPTAAAAVRIAVEAIFLA